MPNINSLNLSDEELPIDVQAMPQGLGSRPRTPQPGIFRFRLPEHPAIENAFDTQDSEDSQILVAVFADDAMLYNETMKQYYVGRVNNRFREINQINRETGMKEPKLISDYGMMMKALNNVPERISNRHLAAALVACAGKSFIAEHTLTATCNDKNPIYKNGSPVQGKFGCGKRYAVDGYKTARSEKFQIPLDTDKNVALRFTCDCGAELKTWGQLQGFRSV